MIDSLIIGNKSSYADFEASMKERTISEPKKKSIKETVPFSNVTYDFSKINGELYWEERTLKYVFEIMADSPEELEEKKGAFKGWIMNVMEEELHDPYITDYYFIATFDDCSCDDSEVEKSTITVTFTAYPYMLANVPKVFESVLKKTRTLSEETTYTVGEDISVGDVIKFSCDNATALTVTIDKSTADSISTDAIKSSGNGIKYVGELTIEEGINHLVFDAGWTVTTPAKEKELVIVNNSCHRVTPTIKTDVAVIITKEDGSNYGVSAGLTTDGSFKLEAGVNVFKLSSSAPGTISFTFAEEIF